MSEYSPNRSSLVFVYGTLKRGFQSAKIMGQAPLLLPDARTKLAKYRMISMRGHFPGVLTDGQHRIAGEVYDAPGPILREMDLLECNGNFYTRHRVGIEGLSAPAWAYIIDRQLATLYEVANDPAIKTDNGVQEWTLHA